MSVDHCDEAIGVHDSLVKVVNVQHECHVERV